MKLREHVLYLLILFTVFVVFCRGSVIYQLSTVLKYQLNFKSLQSLFK